MFFGGRFKLDRVKSLAFVRHTRETSYLTPRGGYVIPSLSTKMEAGERGLVRKGKEMKKGEVDIEL
jgi:hypothetical protein